MKCKIKFLATILLIISYLSLLAQNENYKWSTDLCDCSGIFNPKIYSLEQIQNTYKYLWWDEYLTTPSTAYKIEEIKTLNVDILYQECNEKLTRLKTLKFVESFFWIKLKEARIKEIEETCELKRITMLAYKTPEILKNYKINDKTCDYYRNAIIKGGNEMLDAWKKLHEIQMEHNGSPELLHEKFLEQSNSPDKFKYALIELMSYGWWNCANNYISHVENSEEFENEFQTLFSKVKCNCGEP